MFGFRASRVFRRYGAIRFRRAGRVPSKRAAVLRNAGKWGSRVDGRLLSGAHDVRGQVPECGLSSGVLLSVLKCDNCSRDNPTTHISRQWWSRPFAHLCVTCDNLFTRMRPEARDEFLARIRRRKRLRP